MPRSFDGSFSFGSPGLLILKNSISQHANELQSTQISSTIRRMTRNEVANPLEASEASSSREKVRPRPTGASANLQNRKRDESSDNEIQVEERTVKPLGHNRDQFSAQLEEAHALIPGMTHPTPTLRRKPTNKE